MAYDTGERGQGFDGVLPAGGEEASKALLCRGAGPCSISAKDLAVDHCRTYRLLGRPVRRQSWHPFSPNRTNLQQLTRASRYDYAPPARSRILGDVGDAGRSCDIVLRQPTHAERMVKPWMETPHPRLDGRTRGGQSRGAFWCLVHLHSRLHDGDHWRRRHRRWMTTKKNAVGRRFFRSG